MLTAFVGVAVYGATPRIVDVTVDRFTSEYYNGTEGWSLQCTVTNPSSVSQAVTLKYINGLNKNVGQVAGGGSFQTNAHAGPITLAQNESYSIKFYRKAAGSSTEPGNGNFIYLATPSSLRFEVTSTNNKGYVVARCSIDWNPGSATIWSLSVAGGKPF